MTDEESPPGSLHRPGEPDIAYRQLEGSGSLPGAVFCGGFRSDMGGSKARALEAACAARGQAYLRFDYSGHGSSAGRFEDGTIGAWRDDTLAVLDRLTAGPQLLVGSSMGAWLATLAALARPERVAGLLAIAPALDFTEALMWAAASPEQRRRLLDEGAVLVPSSYDEAGTPVTRALIEEGRRHLLLPGPIALACPVRIVHGMADADVPWPHGVAFAEALSGANVRMTLVKDGDHRLSRPEDLALMTAQLAELTDSVA